MKEWKLITAPQPNQSQRPEFQWRHYNGEVELSLTLTTHPIPRVGARFQVARIIDHPTGVLMFKKPTDYDYERALEITNQGKRYVDIVDDFKSPEELATYCAIARLSLPQGYKAAWEYVDKTFKRS